MYLAKYNSRRYPIPFRYRSGLGCACQPRPLGDIWDSLDSVASSAVNFASIPWNAITGQLTDAQKQALVLEEQKQILAVADSPGAQVSPTVQAAAQQAAIQNAGYAVTDVGAVTNLPPAQPTNYALWILGALALLTYVKL